MTADTFLEEFGVAFWEWTVEYRYDNLLRILGSSLRDFLTNLDALHDHLASVYTGMNAPSFRCMDAGGGDLFLFYYSVRTGLHPIVTGIVKSVAREIYKMKIEMKVVENPDEEYEESRSEVDLSDTASTASSAAMSVTSSNYYADIMSMNIKPVVFLITLDEPTIPMARRPSMLGGSAEDIHIPEKNLISPILLCRAFPFHIVFDRSLHIVQMGLALQRLVKFKELYHLHQLFDVVRPRMPFSFDLIISHINGVFILRSKRGVLKKEYGALRLKGQMLYDIQTNVMLFLCSPRIGSMTQLKRSGLYISDIPIHDASRDLIMQAERAVAEFRLIKQTEELVDSLRQTQSDLQREKMLTERLLHSILPESAANALRQGKSVPAKNFEIVTILFSDIKGFTDICQNAEPLQVVTMLDRMYTRFDKLVEVNEIYKVHHGCYDYSMLHSLALPLKKKIKQILQS